MSLRGRIERGNPLSSKLSKILSISLEDSQTIDALELLNDLYKTNNISARRNLKGDLEKRSLDINKSFLAALGQVYQGLEVLEENINKINESCKAMDKKIKATKEQTNQLVNRTSELKTKRIRCQARKVVVQSFLVRFTLSEAEIHALTSTGSSIRPDFFSAFDHLHRIKEDCNVLLMSEQKGAGLDIIEKMGQYQEMAFDKLFRWTQAECRSLNRESPEISNNFKLAMQAVKQRPVLYSSCIEEIILIRKTAISRSFLDALTRGGPNGTPKPIEIHAHDPQRYIGDMLAWVYQAVAGEREILEGLFFIKEPVSIPNSRRNSLLMDQSTETDPSKISQDTVVAQILDKNIDGTIRPLKGRVEQILNSRPGAISAYKISNLIQFYSNTIEKMLGQNSQLSLALKDLIDLAVKVFFDTLNDRASQLLRFVEEPENDLLPPHILKDSIAELKEILSSFESSMLPADMKQKEVDKVLAAMLDPLLQVCVLGSAELHLIQKASYMINCLHFLHTSLSVYPFTTEHIKGIETQIESQLDVLTYEMYDTILKESKLGPILSEIDSNNDQTPLSLLPNCSYKHISEVMTWFDVYLGSLGVDRTTTITKSLSNSRLARKVLKNSYRKFLEAYKVIYEKVMDPKNKYEFPATILPRTVQEVGLLLAVEKS